MGIKALNCRKGGNMSHKKISSGILILICVVSAFSACSTQNQASPKSKQILFCETISKYREIYDNEGKKEFYIDKEKNLNNIFAERTSELKKVLGDGRIENWNGWIKYIQVEKEGVRLDVELSCNTRLQTPSDLIIKIDTPLYEALRRFHERSPIVFSGNFIICSKNDGCGDFHNMYYRERSITQSGSMDEPEFRFEFRDIR
jgi:hypothetical protein